ncbi:hypothetical protein ACWFNE_12340 [Cellulomonas sp. NPDC055163]
MYLLDANVLSRLTPEQRASRFIKGRCRIPSEVIYEARGLPDAQLVEELEIRASTTMLERLRDVMASIAPEDHSLVDLYRNRGGADPILIASALAANSGETLLWPTVWHIVTDDKAVRTTATFFDIPTLGRTELVELIKDR